MEKTEEEIKQEKINEIMAKTKEMREKEIEEENLDILRKMLIIGCAAQVVHEGVAELSSLKIYRQDFKNKVKNFEKFIKEQSGKHTQMIYKIDEEYAQYLTQALENYITGLCNADPAEIISRYVNAD